MAIFFLLIKNTLPPAHFLFSKLSNYQFLCHFLERYLNYRHLKNLILLAISIDSADLVLKDTDQ